MRFLAALHILLIAGRLAIALPPAASPYNQEVTGKAYGSAGCGLGSVLFGAKGGAIQIVAATSNLLLANQSFGITFGTLNCIDEDEVRRADIYIHANRAALETDTARGRGATLAGLGEILGCKSGPGDDALSALQPHFKDIFPEPGVDSGRVRDKLFETIQNDKVLREKCSIG